MRTKEIFELIWKYLGKHHPETPTRVDLRLALTLLRPKPDFEEYVSRILKDLGYSVQSNQVLKGKCVEHEIDVIAQREGRTILVEVKHHDRPHTYTPLEVPMNVWATLQDLAEGKKLGYHNIDFTNALIVSNTRFTDHARTYADCMGIDCIGWKSPPPNGLNYRTQESLPGNGTEGDRQATPATPPRQRNSTASTANRRRCREANKEANSLHQSTIITEKANPNNTQPIESILEVSRWLFSLGVIKLREYISENAFIEST
jgi:hypothetical protein